MIDTRALKGQFVAKGYTQEDMAKKLGITGKTMTEKLKKGVFNSNEIYIMVKVLELPDPMSIFFVDKVLY